MANACFEWFLSHYNFCMYGLPLLIKILLLLTFVFVFVFNDEGFDCCGGYGDAGYFGYFDERS